MMALVYDDPSIVGPALGLRLRLAGDQHPAWRVRHGLRPGQLIQIPFQPPLEFPRLGNGAGIDDPEGVPEIRLPLGREEADYVRPEGGAAQNSAEQVDGQREAIALVASGLLEPAGG